MLLCVFPPTPMAKPLCIYMYTYDYHAVGHTCKLNIIVGKVILFADQCVLTLRSACVKAVFGSGESVGISTTSAVHKGLALSAVSVKEVLGHSVLTRAHLGWEGAGVEAGTTGARSQPSLSTDTATTKKASCHTQSIYTAHTQYPVSHTARHYTA